jgi:hypothetical protein
MRTGLAATREEMSERYEDDDGTLIATSLEDAAHWAQQHPEKYKKSSIWRIDEDGIPVVVDSDVQDLLVTWAEDAKSEVEVLREALADLKAYTDREILKLRMEVSLAMERKE